MVMPVNPLFWNTIHFAGLALSFVGAILMAVFGSGFRVVNRRVRIDRLARGALWCFAFGALFVIWYEMHQLTGSPA